MGICALDGIASNWAPSQHAHAGHYYQNQESPDLYVNMMSAHSQEAPKGPGDQRANCFPAGGRHVERAVCAAHGSRALGQRAKRLQGALLSCLREGCMPVRDKIIMVQQDVF